MAFKHHVFICENQRTADDPKGSCMALGASGLRGFAKAECHARGLKGDVRINGAGCIDACAQGPAVVVYGEANPPDGVWYTIKNQEQMQEVIDQHLVGGVPVEHLRMRKVPGKKNGDVG